jgi:hypothetical protein
MGPPGIVSSTSELMSGLTTSEIAGFMTLVVLAVVLLVLLQR